MRPLLPILVGLLLIPTVAAAQSAEYTYNTYKRDIKKQTDAGWAELQAADASTSQEERCRHAGRAVYSYNEAARTAQTMVEILAYGGDRAIYDEGVGLRDAARDVAQEVEQMVNQQCG